MDQRFAALDEAVERVKELALQDAPDTDLHCVHCPKDCAEQHEEACAWGCNDLGATT